MLSAYIKVRDKSFLGNSITDYEQIGKVTYS
jgi:hypothetical protein